MILTSIYDKVAKEFGPVGVVQNEEVAVRQFKGTMLKIVEQPYIREDYDLYMLGTFSPEEGILDLCKKVIDVGSHYLPKPLTREGVE